METRTSLKRSKKNGEKVNLIPIKFSTSLTACEPTSSIPAYVHIFHLKPNLDTAVNEIPHYLQNDNNLYGFVTKSQIPQVSEFSIYIKSLEVFVRIQSNAFSVKLSEAQIKNIRNFHTFLFSDIIKITPKFLVVDNRNCENSYMIVPLERVPRNGEYRISWVTIENGSLKSSTEENKIRINKNGKLLDQVLEYVVTPWYRKREIDLLYVVQKVDLNLTPLSEFPAENYKTFEEYYRKKYGIILSYLDQPLLQARCITPQLNLTRPAGEKIVKRHGGAELFLVPELCVRQEFKSSYWLKSYTLPTILHIMHYLLSAETLKKNLSSHIQIQDSKSLYSLPNFASIEKVDDTVPVIKMIGCNNLSEPTQHELYEAIVYGYLDNMKNFQSLETLGDCLLKFVISLYVFTECTGPVVNLTSIRAGIVGNVNLAKCGHSKNLGSYLKVQCFCPTNWCPPRFHIPNEIIGMVRNLNLSIQYVVPNLVIPADERSTGILSDKTLNRFKEEILNEKQITTPKNLPNSRTLAFMKYHNCEDKMVADSLEAIIGVYLKCSGMKHACQIMKYFGILPNNINIDQLLNDSSLSEELLPVISIGEDADINYYGQLEKTLGYEFKNKSFLFQALTHECSVSWKSNNSHYERLEFMGDAILDILVTSYFYEYCDKKNSSDLTEMRSVIVNNGMLARFALRIGLQKYILCGCHHVMIKINALIEAQKNDGVCLEEKIIYRDAEPNRKIFNYLTAPKLLSDVFESLAAAIYFDSGKDLNVVWRVCYNIMKKELGEIQNQNFNQKNPLHVFTTKYSSTQCDQIVDPRFTNGSVCASVNFKRNGEIINYCAMSRNLKLAKLCCAKFIIRDDESLNNNCHEETIAELTRLFSLLSI